MKKTSITAVVLAKNEEKNIASCLRHLQWVDDLVVLDSGSIDSTLKIAKEFGARIFTNITEKFYIADQRNWALDNAEIKTDWVLFIDADEVVTQQLKKEILNRISHASSETAGFQLCFKFMFLGRWLKHAVDFPTWHDRLARYGKTRFKGKVWESFDTQGGVEKIYEPYLHYGFNNGMGAWIDRHQRYADWKAEQMMKKDLIAQGSFEGKRIIEKLGTRTGLLSPLLRFLYHYFIKKGFLDGKPGLIYSFMMSYYQFMIYLYFLEKKNSEFKKDY